MDRARHAPRGQWFAGGWNVNFQWIKQTGFIIDSYPNATPLQSVSPSLTEEQRLDLAKAKGHPYWDVSQDLWFDTSLFPRQAQAPYTLRNFPTRLPDVRAQGVDSWEASAYKDIRIKEKLTFQIRVDLQNAMNHPWFGQAASTVVTDARFGLLIADQNNEPRDILFVAKILF